MKTLALAMMLSTQLQTPHQKKEIKPLKCSYSKTYKQIIKDNKNIDKLYAIKLSKIIDKKSIKYKIPSQILSAILMQESGYKLNSMNCKKGLIIDHKNIRFKKFKEGRVCTDFGISQIYYKSVKRYKFDLDKLTTDLEYSVDAGAKVLSWFHKTYSKNDPNWYTRYNCGTKGKTTRKTCQTYKKLVSRYL